MRFLTERQIQVGKLISAGKSNAEIAYELGITERTVRMHSDNIKANLGLQHKRQIPGTMRDLGF